MKIILLKSFPGDIVNVQPIKNGELTILNNKKDKLKEGIDYILVEPEDVENIFISIPFINGNPLLIQAND